MSWEFRKVKPGDNVAVEAQRDPFAAPKWAPPIWHMPEGLVLLVNLLRILARAVVFCLRHPIVSGAVVVAGWLASPGHCANIMSADFAEMGAAFVLRAGTARGIWWTQTFGRR